MGTLEAKSIHVKQESRTRDAENEGMLEVLWGLSRWKCFAPRLRREIEKGTSRTRKRSRSSNVQPQDERMY